MLSPSSERARRTVKIRLPPLLAVVLTSLLKFLRLNEISDDYIQKQIIPGIECIGEIADRSICIDGDIGEALKDIL